MPGDKEMSSDSEQLPIATNNPQNEKVPVEADCFIYPVKEGGNTQPNNVLPDKESHHVVC